MERWLSRLKRVYNRGFSTGFYFGLPTGSEIEVSRSGNISDYKKVQIGEVLSYYSNKKAAKILLTRGKLRLGDEVFIIGTNTDTYLRQEITSIQIKGKKNLTETPRVRGSNDRLAVGILVDEPVKQNDKVYVLKPRNIPP